MSKRLTAAFLSAVMLFALLTALSACGAPTGSPSEQSEEENTELLLDGYSCVIAQKYEEDNPFRYKPGTLYAENILKRMADIDSKCGSETSFNVCSTSPFLEGTISSVVSGQYVAELAYTEQPTYLAYADVLVPLTDVKEYVDYEDSAKYGSAGLLEIGMKDGIPYAVIPVQWPEKLTSVCYAMMCVNENLISENNLTDPREFVENGSWRWDKFLEMLPLYTMNNGDGSEISGFTTMWNILEAAAFSNGMTFMMEQNGSQVPGIQTKQFAEAVDFYHTLRKDYADNISIFSKYEDCLAYYLNNQAVLYQTSFAHMQMDVVYESKNYGTVPFPCGPSGEYGTWNACISGMDSFGIYTCSELPEYAAMYISMLFEPFEGYNTDEQRKAALDSFLYTDADIDFYLKHLNNIHFDYWTCGMTDLWSVMQGKALTGSSGAELAEKHSNQFTDILNKYAAGNNEYMSSHS